MTENQPKKISKSDRTRAQILEAARHLFAEHGYDGASIRDVAAQASIDPAMVIRYFRSKDELFARAAVVDLQLPELRVIDRTAIGETLIRRFLEIWEGPASGPGMAILLRSATSNEFAAEKLREVFANQVRPVVAVGRRPPPTPVDGPGWFRASCWVWRCADTCCGFRPSSPCRTTKSSRMSAPPCSAMPWEDALTRASSIVGRSSCQRLHRTRTRRRSVPKRYADVNGSCAGLCETCFTSLWILGGKPVHNTTCWGEQTGKIGHR